MVRFKKWICGSLILFWAQLPVVYATESAPSVKATQASGHRTLVTQVYTASGLEDMVKRFPELLKEGVAGGMNETGQQDKNFVRELSSIIDSAIDEKVMGEKIQQHLGGGLTDAQMTSVMTWLNSSIGSKVIALEKKAVTTESVQEMEAKVVELQRKYKGSERELQFAAFDKATDMTEASLETAMAVQVALAGAFASAGEGASPLTYEQLQELVEANRFMTRGLIGQQVYTSFLYTYEPLSKEELQAYIDFAETNDGSRYFRVINAALRDVLIEPSREIGKNIMRVALEAK